MLTSYPRYRSTRGGEVSISLEEALLKGLARDGGLYIPDAVPSLSSVNWRGSEQFSILAADILHLWLGEVLGRDEVSTLAAEAFNFDVPVVPLEGKAWQGVYVLELFHGPTLSFKDFGARTMARLMSHFLRGRGESVTILVATSGDTGSAVADGFAGQDHIRVVLLYPQGQVSPVQERQLIIRRPGVFPFAVQGTFDDCQRMVKQAFVDADLSHVLLSSANSINIGRLIPQSLYYVWAVNRGSFEEVVFSVPSGNLGDLTGGVLAWLGGLPVRKFIAAHNANDFFPRYLSEGKEEYRDSARTLSNAMDVGVPSNYERLRALLTPQEMRKQITGTSVSDAETLESMRRVYEQTGYLADPHTAVGLEAARRYRRSSGDMTPIVVLSTAHPAKFPETVEKALGFSPETPDRLDAFWKKEISVELLAPNVEALKVHLLSYAGM